MCHKGIDYWVPDIRLRVGRRGDRRQLLHVCVCVCVCVYVCMLMVQRRKVGNGVCVASSLEFKFFYTEKEMSLSKML